MSDDAACCWELSHWERPQWKEIEILKNNTILKLIAKDLAWLFSVKSHICDFFLLEQKINTAVSMRTVLCYNLTDWSGKAIQKQALFATENFLLLKNCVSLQVWDHSRTQDRVTMSLELAENFACCFLGVIGREYSGSGAAKIIAKFFQQSSQIWRSSFFQPTASWELSNSELSFLLIVIVTEHWDVIINILSHKNSTVKRHFL